MGGMETSKTRQIKEQDRWMTDEDALPSPDTIAASMPARKDTKRRVHRRRAAFKRGNSHECKLPRQLVDDWIPRQQLCPICRCRTTGRRTSVLGGGRRHAHVRRRARKHRRSRRHGRARRPSRRSKLPRDDRRNTSPEIPGQRAGPIRGGGKPKGTDEVRLDRQLHRV